MTDVSIPESTVLLIAGMHRSGTSALTRIVNLLGAQLPNNLMAANEQENAKGYWESIDIAAFNDELLHSVGSSWDDVLPIDFSELSDEKSNELSKKASFLLDRDWCKSSLFAIKDPRFCRILPFWLSLLLHKGVKPYVIIPFRHPLEVAASLERRDGFPLDKGIYLWLRSYVDVLRHSSAVPVSVVSYKALMADWSATMEKIGHDLGLKWPVDSLAISEKISEYLDPRLSHFNFDCLLTSDRFIGQLANQLYSALLSGSSDLVALAETMHDTLSSVEASFQPFMSTKGERPEGLCNNVVTNRSKYYIQLFYDIGSGFVEVDSVRNRFDMTNMKQDFTFCLQGLESLQSLRIDPLDDSAVILVEEILLTTESGAIDLTSMVKSNARAVNKELYYFETADPQIYFDGLESEKLAHAKTLVLKLHYICVGYYAKLISQYSVSADDHQRYEKLENRLFIIQDKIDKQLNINNKLMSFVECVHNDILVNFNNAQIREEKLLFLYENRLNSIRNFYESKHKAEITRIENKFNVSKEMMVCKLDKLIADINLLNENYKNNCEYLLAEIERRDHELKIIRSWYGFSLLEKINKKLILNDR